jgi:PAS domain S-box-containing protein
MEIDVPFVAVTDARHALPRPAGRNHCSPVEARIKRIGLRSHIGCIMGSDQRGSGVGHFHVIAMVASAGGHAAVAAVLRGLPDGFSIPLVVVQHLSPQTTGIADVYRRLVAMPVEAIEAGSRLTPGKVLVAPPRMFVELLPDGTFALKPCKRGALDKPLDHFLDSVARSFGPHAVGIVLTGRVDDGAAGARQLHQAGGCVLVQSEATAEHPDMPRAAIQAGAADLIVPLANLGQVIGEVVAGTPRPKARSELGAIGRVFGDRGEVAARAREVDWSRTPLGPVLSWPRDLRLMARAVVENSYPMAVWWGPELIQVYNDKWMQFLGSTKHPQALGGRARDTWPEIWHIIGPMLDRVMTTGEPVGEENFPIYLKRNGVLEEVFATFAYAPIRDPMTGAITGVHNTATETTATVIAERRMRLLRELATRTVAAATLREACERAAAALAADPADLPFALLYQIDDVRRQATLAGAAGLLAGSPAAPRLVDTAIANGQETWPLHQGMSQPVLLEDLPTRFPGPPVPSASPHGTLPPHAAMLLPLRLATDTPATAVLVAGLSPHRPFDKDFRSFLDLVVQQITLGLIDARAREIEHERIERLSELDRAKTEFFANVSHEFRTPLTLLLAPLEELLGRRDHLPPTLVQEIDVAARNARRLLGLVNNLLDFSQLETRRRRAALEPLDIGAVTANVASLLRSAIEAAGLRFRVECDASVPPVPVNREMWEKVVSNLLSNAFKFTFEGEISVTLRARALHAELRVADTGVGIPADELPNIFKRFHRVRGTRARTAEGSGIGLAIVDDLVKRMGGQIRVRSLEGRGTAFTIWMPYKAIRQGLEPGVEAPAAAAVSAGAVATDLADEASRWHASANGHAAGLDGVVDDLLGLPARIDVAASAPVRARILVADDNADLRDYLRRLFTPHWDVELVPDGQAALGAVRRNRPDVVLADVMMPHLDGFELLKQIRKDPELRYTPVVLVTARAGEEAAIEGLLAGADDYIAKPFSPRELVARVRAVVERSRTEAALRESEAKLAIELADTKELHRISSSLIANDNIDALYNQVLEAARALMRSDIASIQKLAGEGDELLLLAHHGFVPESAKFWQRVRMEDTTSCGLALARRKPIIVPDVELWDYAAGTDDLVHYRLCGIRGMLSTPLVSRDGRIVGMISTHWREVHQPSERELRLLDLLARQAADLIERRTAEEALRTSEAWLAGQKEAFQAAIHGATLGESLGVLVRIAINQMGEGFRCAFYIADPEGRELRHVVGMPEYYAECVDGFKIGPDSLACGLAVYTGRPVVTPDVTREPRWQPWLWLAEQYEYRACWSFPIETSSGKVVGTLAMYFKSPRAATPRDHELAMLLTRAAAIIISRSQEAEERARAEIALRASEARYRSLFNSIDEGFCTIKVLFDEAGRPVDYQFLEANAAFERQTGLRDVIGHRMRELTPGHEQHWFDVYGRVALTGEPTRFEHRAEALGRWYDVYAFGIGDPQQREVAILFTDITSRKHTDEQLRDSEQRQAFLLNLSDVLRPLADPVEIKSAATRLLGEKLGVNRAFYAVAEDGHWLVTKGYEQGVEPLPDVAFPMAKYGQWIIDGFCARRPLIVHDMAKDGRFQPAELAAHQALQIASEVAVPLVKEGALLAMLVVHSAQPRPWNEQDLALIEETAERTWAAVEQAKAEAALRESEARLRAVLEQAPLAIVFIGRSGEILFRNAMFDELLGRPALATTAHTYSDVYEGYHLDGRPIASEEWPGARAVLQGEVVENEVYEIVQASGRRIPCWFAAAPIWDASGKILGGVVLFRDMSEEGCTHDALRANGQRP